MLSWVSVICVMLDTSNDPSEFMTYAGLYEIGDKAF